MAGRPGFLGGLHQGDAPERDADSGFGSGGLIGGSPFIRLGDPNSGRSDGGFGTPPGFDPVWGTLGAPPVASGDDWLARNEDENEGLAVDVEILGAGFQISGQVRTGQFDRLSDWINMQTGFIQVRDAWHVHLGQTHAPAPDQRKGTLWVRLNQVVMVAERAPALGVRPGAPVVQKQRRRVSIVTPGYNLLGSLYVHSHGSMTQFLESPDPHFLPLTDITVHWLSDPAMAARFPFGMVNREQLVTIFDEGDAPGGDAARTPSAEYEDDMPLHRRSGAA
jgi:hypothetical protein